MWDQHQSSNYKERRRSRSKDKSRHHRRSRSNEHSSSRERRRSRSRSRDERRSGSKDLSKSNTKDRRRSRSRDKEYSKPSIDDFRPYYYKEKDSSSRHNRRYRDKDSSSSHNLYSGSRDGSHKSYSRYQNSRDVKSTSDQQDSVVSSTGDNYEKDDDDEEDLKPVSLNITCPAANKFLKQIEQRKLLFSKKDKPVESTSTSSSSSSSSVWQKTQFNDDSDGKMSAKFKRLMGIKNAEQAESSPSADTQKKKGEPGGGPQSKDYFVNLEKQYEVARTITHTQRGMGLGFGSSGGLSTLNKGIPPPSSAKDK